GGVRFCGQDQDMGTVTIMRPIAMISEDCGFVKVGLDAASLWWWYYHRRGSVIVVMAMTASRHSHQSCHAIAGGFLQSLGWGVSDSTLLPIR
ncbi:6926_t:CDS:2, partial [Acaulospora morrowiae]